MNAKPARITSDNHALAVGGGDVDGASGRNSVAQSIADGAADIGTNQPAISPMVARYLKSSTAAATRRAYRGDIGDFLRWGGLVPCTPRMLAEYVAERAEVHCPSTIARRVVGIGKAHVAHGFPDPSKDELVKLVLRGVRREHGTAQRQAAPLVTDDLVMGIERLATGIRGARDRALLLLGFAAGLRRSELVGLDVADLRFVVEGVLLRVRRSKTDQEAAGRTVAVPHGRLAVCPVLALKHWLAVAGVCSGPVFRAVSRADAVSAHRLSNQVVSHVVKNYVRLLGKSPEAYSGHSLRAGFVTSAAQAGAGLLLIQKQTGHRSMAMLCRYLRTVDPFEGNAAAGLL